MRVPVALNLVYKFLDLHHFDLLLSLKSLIVLSEWTWHAQLPPRCSRNCGNVIMQLLRQFGNDHSFKSIITSFLLSCLVNVIDL